MSQLTLMESASALGAHSAASASRPITKAHVMRQALRLMPTELTFICCAASAFCVSISASSKATIKAHATRQLHGRPHWS